MPRNNSSRNPSCANDTTWWVGGLGWTQITGQTVGSTGKTTAGRVAVPNSAYPNVGQAGSIAATDASAGGRAVSWAAMVRSSVARNYDPALSKYNGTAYQSMAVTGTRVALTANAWTLVRGTGTIATGGTYDRIGLHNDLPTAAAGTFDVAAVRIELDVTDAALVPADGDTPGWAWDGVAGSSTSQESGTVQKTGGDSGTGSETGTVTVTATGSDQGVGSETGRAAELKTGSDAGTGSETGYIAQGQTGSDTGAGTESGSLGATVTSGDSAAGSESGGVGATLVPPGDSGQGSETGKIVLPGRDSGAGAEQLGRLDANVVYGDTGSGAEGGYVEARWGDLVVSVYAVIGGALVPLPDFVDLTMSRIRNGSGAISLRYPPSGQNFGLLYQNTLGRDADLEVEIWTLGNPNGALRGYLQEGSGDDVAESGTWTFSGGFAELRLGEAEVYPQPLTGEATLGPTVTAARSSVTSAQWNRLTATLGYSPSSDADPTVSVPQKILDAVKANAATVPVLADPKRELVFTAVTPGAMVLFALAQARARGALVDFTTSFTGTTDSAGNAWPSLVSTKFSPGAKYDQILNLLAQLGRAEWGVRWTGTAYCLDLWVAGKRGTDRTTGLRPIVLRAARNISEAPRKWSVRSSPTAMLGIGAEGVYADTSDANAQARRGRRIEASTSSQNLQTPDAVLAYAQRRLSTDNPGTLEVTHALALLPGEPRPVVAFDIGDFLYSVTDTPLDRYRVVEWTMTVNVASQVQPGSTVTLNDAFVDAQVRAQQQLDALSSGETVVGTSSASNQADLTPPSPPSGLLVSSGALNEGIDAYAVVLVAWTAPTTNVDGSALTGLAGYRVEWTEEARPGEWRSAANVDGGTTQAQFTTATGLPIRVRVAAFKASGAQSTWLTSTFAHTTETDSTPPPTPSAPVGSSALGLISFTWDGKSADGAAMFQAAPDFAWVELHLSTSSNFTPSASTLMDTIQGGGTYTYAKLPDGTALSYDVTYYCRLVAVDVRKNRQTVASGQGSATPRKLLGPDIFAGAVGTAALGLAVIKAANIDVAQINDAHMVNVNVGKLIGGIVTASMIFSTGKISTRANDGTTGPGWTGDSAGLRLYDPNGNINVQFKSADGSAMIAGEYRTSLTSGRRLVFNPNGSAPDEIRVYPGNTNQYARIKTVEDGVSTTYQNMAGIGMKAYSPRSDQQSGEVNVFPAYARLAFSNEMGGGAVASSVGCEKHQAGMGGPRIQLAAQSNTSEAEDSVIRLGVLNNAGTAFAAQATVQLDNGGNYGYARWWSPGQNCGFQFNQVAMAVINSGNALINIHANAFIATSDPDLKTDVEALDPDAATAAVLGARTYRYEKRAELGVPRRPGRREVGLMTDELPCDLVHWLGEHGHDGVDVYGVVAVAWAALRAEIERGRRRDGELLELRAAIAPTGRPLGRRPVGVRAEAA